MSEEKRRKSAEPEEERISFYPFFLFEVTLAALFMLEFVLILAFLFPASLGREIDFSAQYTPRPEWYFLFLYQLTKYFPGKWTFVGAVLLPGLAFSLIVFTPFLDAGNETSPRRRSAAALTGLTLLGGVIALTLLSLL